MQQLAKPQEGNLPETPLPQHADGKKARESLPFAGRVQPGFLEAHKVITGIL